MCITVRVLRVNMHVCCICVHFNDCIMVTGFCGWLMWSKRIKGCKRVQSSWHDHDMKQTDGHNLALSLSRNVYEISSITGHNNKNTMFIISDWTIQDGNFDKPPCPISVLFLFHLSFMPFLSPSNVLNIKSLNVNRCCYSITLIHSQSFPAHRPFYPPVSVSRSFRFPFDLRQFTFLSPWPICFCRPRHDVRRSCETIGLHHVLVRKNTVNSNPVHVLISTRDSATC